MSFVLVAKTAKTETYRIRCDKCGAISDEVEIQRPDACPAQYRRSYMKGAREEMSRLSKESSMRRLGSKHFCEDTCYAPPKKMEQETLFDKAVIDKINPQAWVG